LQIFNSFVASLRLIVGAARKRIVMLMCLSLCCGLGTAPASANEPAWQLQYLAENRRCELGEVIRAPTETDPWRDVLQNVPVKSQKQLWLRLHARENIRLSQSWVASAQPILRRLLYIFPDLAQANAQPSAKWLLIDSPKRPFQFAHAVLAVELPRQLEAGQSLSFCLDKSGWVSSDMLKIEAEPTFRANDAAFAQFETACLAIIGAMLISALFYALTLRDPVYFWYVGHIAAFAIFESRINYSLFRWLEGLPGTPALGYRIAEIALGISVLCATKFAQVFLDLDQHFPRIIAWLNRIAWTCLGLCMVLAVIREFAELQLPGDASYSYSLVGPTLVAMVLVQNALIAMIGCLTLACAMRVAFLGKRAARFYLASSLPLVLGSILASAYAIFVNPSASLTVFLLPLAAFEALALSLGMADRALSLRQERDDARRRAEHDPLTGQLNRSGLLAQLAQHQQLKFRSKISCAILYCDLDYFKRVNDQYGHEAGDKCLLHFVDCAQSVLRHTENRQRARASDWIARVGGEEFVLLLTNCNANQALHVGERICRKVRQTPLVWQGSNIWITLSIGVATVQADDGAESAIAAADRALYQAKHEGRDRVCLAAEG
jgi:diguanylate cyclase (GGDEF)-like protein